MYTMYTMYTMHTMYTMYTMYAMCAPPKKTPNIFGTPGSVLPFGQKTPNIFGTIGSASRSSKTSQNQQSPWCRGSSRASPRMQIDTIQEKLPVSTADLNLSQEYPLYMEICKGPCWRRTVQS